MLTPIGLVPRGPTLCMDFEVTSYDSGYWITLFGYKFWRALFGIEVIYSISMESFMVISDFIGQAYEISGSVGPLAWSNRSHSSVILSLMLKQVSMCGSRNEYLVTLLIGIIITHLAIAYSPVEYKDLLLPGW